MQAIAGVKLAITALAQLLRSPSKFTFVYPDIEKISAKVKDMNITAHAEGMALYSQSMERKGDEADRLFTLAMRKFESAISSTPDNRFTIKSWGDALHEQV